MTVTCGDFRRLYDAWTCTWIHAIAATKRLWQAHMTGDYLLNAFWPASLSMIVAQAQAQHRTTFSCWPFVQCVPCTIIHKMWQYIDRRRVINNLGWSKAIVIILSFTWNGTPLSMKIGRNSASINKHPLFPMSDFSIVTPSVRWQSSWLESCTTTSSVSNVWL